MRHRTEFNRNWGPRARALMLLNDFGLPDEILNQYFSQDPVKVSVQATEAVKNFLEKQIGRIKDGEYLTIQTENEIEENVAKLTSIINFIGEKEAEAAAQKEKISTRDAIIEIGEIKIDLGKRQVWKGDREINLTQTQFSFLLLLVERRGRLVTREEIIENVYGGNNGVTDGAISTIASKTRKKLRIDRRNNNKANHKTRRLIYTLYGRGYQIVEEVRNGR